jgi:hypothetical protein
MVELLNPGTGQFGKKKPLAAAVELLVVVKFLCSF